MFLFLHVTGNTSPEYLQAEKHLQELLQRGYHGREYSSGSAPETFFPPRIAYVENFEYRPDNLPQCCTDVQKLIAEIVHHKELGNIIHVVALGCGIAAPFVLKHFPWWVADGLLLYRPNFNHTPAALRPFTGTGGPIALLAEPDDYVYYQYQFRQEHFGEFGLHLAEELEEQLECFFTDIDFMGLSAGETND
ncbi:hypothetical protein [Desulfurispira natronophila]|uniref:Uncharacterized protein n=1 Tax=Desulfurispira natronophila TaxID=682562 RepID=A0A7W7Y3P2_9BACT|nr:hypothetical protein [Desulfurispira natronophila]MBB5021354.1 hypothetical protein [Desulfurispira natronophila]